MNFIVATKDSPLGGVDAQVAKAHVDLAAAAALTLIPSEYGVYARQQLRSAEWFGQVIVGAEVQTAYFVSLLPAAVRKITGTSLIWRISWISKAVFAVHANIQKREVDGLGGENVDGFARAGRGSDLVPCRLQVQIDEPQITRLVVT
jgi:hypothetical protein